ncbi:hypothetical protein ACLOJK_008522 [Asimina triloba]
MSVQAASDPVKVRVIVTEFVETDALSFKAVVQRLTGRDSNAAAPAAEMVLEGSHSATAATEKQVVHEMACDHPLPQFSLCVFPPSLPSLDFPCSLSRIFSPSGADLLPGICSPSGADLLPGICSPSGADLLPGICSPSGADLLPACASPPRPATISSLHPPSLPIPSRFPSPSLPPISSLPGSSPPPLLPSDPLRPALVRPAPVRSPHCPVSSSPSLLPSDLPLPVYPFRSSPSDLPLPVPSLSGADLLPVICSRPATISSLSAPVRPPVLHLLPVRRRSPPWHLLPVRRRSPPCLRISSPSGHHLLPASSRPTACASPPCLRIFSPSGHHLLPAL